MQYSCIRIKTQEQNADLYEGEFNMDREDFEMCYIAATCGMCIYMIKMIHTQCVEQICLGLHCFPVPAVQHHCPD